MCTPKFNSNKSFTYTKTFLLVRVFQAMKEFFRSGHFWGKNGIFSVFEKNFVVDCFWGRTWAGSTQTLQKHHIYLGLLISEGILMVWPFLTKKIVCLCKFICVGIIHKLDRGIKEAIYIRAYQPTLNRHPGRYQLSHVYDKTLSTHMRKFNISD